MALESASDSATRRLKRAAFGPRPDARQWRAITSTASSTTWRSVGTRTEITSPLSPLPTGEGDAAAAASAQRRTQSLRGAKPPSESGEGGGGRVGNAEQRIEFSQLEQRPQVLVEPREPKLAVRLPNLAGQRDQYPEPRGIDIPGIGEVDQELAFPLLKGLGDLLLKLLAVPDDELPVPRPDPDAPWVFCHR